MRMWSRLPQTALLAAALTAGYLAWLQLTGNVHTVVRGELYRSAQVTAERLRTFQADVGIRSVINLRGADPGAAWYDEEVAAAGALGLVHYDFAMSDRRPFSSADAARLIDLMRAAPKPLLLHCRAGSDRTGLAAALYLAGITGTDVETAEAQLSLRYGHLGIPLLSAAYPMDQSWERLESLFRRSPAAPHAGPPMRLSIRPETETGVS